MSTNMVQNRRRVGNSRRSNVSRIVNSRLRSMHLNSEPNWHLVKTRSNDPPPYAVDVSYQRKVRIVTNLSPTGSITFTAGAIAAAVFGTSTAAFQRMLVTRIDAWGAANAAAFIVIAPSIATIQGEGTPAKEFSDRGVQGARRPHVALTISPKDAAWILISTGVSSNVAEVRGTNSEQVIVDFMVHFSGLAQAVSEFPRETPSGCFTAVKEAENFPGSFLEDLSSFSEVDIESNPDLLENLVSDDGLSVVT